MDIRGILKLQAVSIVWEGMLRQGIGPGHPAEDVDRFKYLLIILKKVPVAIGGIKDPARLAQVGMIGSD